ncbi:MAG TPA: GNAT family N-acetyltransferase [Xanthomonadales bacterium]|nr:GNAT family N-acetyltransferase [Xanthomonadales bacterium]
MSERIIAQPVTANLNSIIMSAPASGSPILHTPRLVLRPVQEGDVEDIYAIYSDETALEHFAREPLEDLADAQKMLDDNLAFDEDKAAKFWAICLAESDRMIGTFTLFHISESNRRGEVGYILNREFWGNGYASEALKCMIDYCFDTLEFGRLEADVDPANTGSLRLLERNGFEREGYFRKRWYVRDTWFDSVMFGLINPGIEEKD